MWVPLAQRPLRAPLQSIQHDRHLFSFLSGCFLWMRERYASPGMGTRLLLPAHIENATAVSTVAALADIPEEDIWLAIHPQIAQRIRD